MSVVTGTIVETGQAVSISIPTVRIPELPLLGAPIELIDKIAVYDNSENSTRYQELSAIRDLFATGGSGAGIPPVLQGSDLEIIADLTNMSGHDPVTDTYNRVLVTALSGGEDYTLERVGYGQLLTSQFLKLPSGGFELTTDKVRIGDIFFAHIYGAVSAPPGGGGGGGGTSVVSLVNGIVIVSDDLTLNTTHNNKLLHVSSPTKNVTLTLHNIPDAPANLIIPIETTLSNGYYTRVTTQGGQLIYFAGNAVTSIWLAANEFLWLLLGTDGWYVMKASESILAVGKPSFDVMQRLNTVIAKGQTAKRSDFPRIMEMLNSNPSLVTTEALRDSTTIVTNIPGVVPYTVYPLRAMYTSGDGSATFRFPDLQNLAFRALNNIGGADPERYPLYNRPGVIQPDMTRAHTHDEETGSRGTRGWSGDNDTDNLGPAPKKVSATGGTETRMINVGMLPLINI